MKKLFFPAVAALAFGLASCSSDNVTPGNNGEPAFAEGGYAKVAIALPTQNGDSRGVNDKFDDGLASEYRVNKATLVLFQGNDEATAKFHSAYNLNVSMEGYDDTPNQITSTTKIVKRVNDGDLSGSKLYAMVILNGGNNVYVGTDNVNDVHIYGHLMNNTTTLGTLQGLKVWNSSDFTNGGILMMNAPLANKAGGTSDPSGAEIHTLVDFTNAVYKTEAEAQANTATDVYVERAVAKVTMDQTPTKNTLQGNSINYKDGSGSITFTIDEWGLDLTNKVSYLSRNASTAWNSVISNATGSQYRFIGSSPVKTGVSLYRTYFAKDPNFGDAGNPVDLSEFNKVNLSTDLSTAFGDNSPMYCFENTFNVANQNQDQTTRVVLKVKIGNEGSFYTFNGDKSTLYVEDKMKKRVKAAIVNDAAVIDWWNNNANTGEVLDETKVDFTPSAREASTGKVYVDKIKVTSSNGKVYEVAKSTDDDKKAELNDRLGLGDILEYVDGYAYYPIRIKHFGDELTPWNSTETPLPTAGTIYPTTNRQNNYLGRYGVLRNNWYSIKVNKISGLGDAEVPSYSSEPDDELYNYIAVRINILSWAKRQQNADL